MKVGKDDIFQPIDRLKLALSIIYERKVSLKKKSFPSTDRNSTCRIPSLIKCSIKNFQE